VPHVAIYVGEDGVATPGGHEEAERERDSERVGGEEVLGGRLADGSGGIGLDEAVGPDGDCDCAVVRWNRRKVGWRDLLPKHDITPRMEVKERKRRGRKLNGIRMMPHTTFQNSVSQPGIRAFMLSAKRTTRATHAARSSRENNMLTAMRALLPKDTKARSAKVMSELSTSRHFASSFAV
jgi:hypothetical protein